uniref:Rap guanine nucleotide exchange factor (GEF) 5b n=1 Tax=Electrophorus electricus TaxID=8005 RepID=A0A4W4FVY8_ELEEL
MCKRSFFVLKTCVKNVPCAGHALRNAFLSNGQENWKAHVKLARIIKRSYVGLELVRWLMEQCAFVQSRGAAAGVWNILLELDILLSVERQSMFEDSGALYQFSFEECEAQSCDFRNQSQWQNGVSFLIQLVPHTQLHVDTHKHRCLHDIISPEVCGRVAQMRALERLTSTGGDTLALSAIHRGQASPERSSPMAWDCGLRYVFSVSPALQQGPGAASRDREDISRMEMVQRLAKDGCRLLHSPLRQAERPAEVRRCAHTSRTQAFTSAQPCLLPESCYRA